jgi:hypothetical protein
MVDRVASTQPFPVPDAGCRAGLHDLATTDLVAYRAHPWLLQVATSRTCSGHIGRYDAALALLAGSGLAAIEVAGCIAAVKSYTRGAAGAVVEAEQAPAATGSSDAEWREQRAPLLAERMDGLFPRFAALERAVTLTTILSVMQVALTGGLFDLPPLLRWLPVPARLGFVAEASYLDLNRLRAPSGATDPLWEHTASNFWTLLGVTGLLFVVATATITWGPGPTTSTPLSGCLGALTEFTHPRPITSRARQFGHPCSPLRTSTRAVPVTSTSAVSDTPPDEDLSCRGLSVRCRS